MKECCTCKKQKPDTDFRVRHDKRCNPVLIYLNSDCKDCDAAKQKERIRRQRATPEGKKRHNGWAKQFHQRHREKCINYMRDKRKTPEFKEYMRQYRLKNKEKIHKQEVLTKKRYHEKNRDNVTDKYVLTLLANQGKIQRGQSVPQDVLEIKKTQIVLSRVKKALINKTKKA